MVLVQGWGARARGRIQNKAKEKTEAPGEEESMRKRAWCRVQIKEKGQHRRRGRGCRCRPLLLEEKGPTPESSSVAELSEYVQISFRTKETPRAGMRAGVDLTQEG